MTLGNRIKLARYHANLDRHELAFAIGCSYDMIAKLENNQRAGTTLLNKIAKACAVNLDWIEFESGDMLNHQLKAQQEIAEYSNNEFIDLFNALDNRHKKTVIDLMRGLVMPFNERRIEDIPVPLERRKSA